jgi:hypothetical protein
MSKLKFTAKLGWDIGIIDVLPEGRKDLRLQEHYNLFSSIRVDPALEVLPDSAVI